MRRAQTAEQRETQKTITSDTIADSGKVNDADISTSGIKELMEEGEEKQEEQAKLFVPILKANNEEQTITGVVLQPEIVDGQGDIISKEVIAAAAHEYLSSYNKSTKLGLMHKIFKPQFELYESFIAPVDMVIGDSLVSAGSWIIVVHVLDANIWKQIKDGKLRGFSIGGKATVVKLKPQKVA